MTSSIYYANIVNINALELGNIYFAQNILYYLKLVLTFINLLFNHLGILLIS